MSPKQQEKAVLNRPIGYSRYKLLLDEEGRPVDASFLEVNPGFSSYFGLDLEELKSISKFQLFAEFYKGEEQEWLNKYYEVAINGDSFTEVVYFEPGDLQFEMSVYSPVKGEFITLFQDFSNRQNNDESYLNILANMSDAVFITDYQGRFKFVCPNVKFIFNMTDVEVAELQLIDELIGPNYKQRIKDKDAGDSEELIRNMEQTVIGNDGRVHHLLINVKQIDLFDGELLFVCRDVTEQYEKARQVRNEKRKLKTMMDTIPDLVWLKDLDGKFLACNKEFEKFFGASEAEIIGRKDADFVDQSMVELFRSNDKRAMQAEGAVKNEERIVYKSDGRVIDVETTKLALKDSDGETIGVLGVARDITERLVNESRFREMIRQAPYGIALVAENGSPYMVNASLCNMLDYTQDELIKMTFEEFTHPDDFAEDFERYQQLVSGEIQSYTVNKRYIKKNGKVVFANLVVCMIDDPYSEGGKRALAMVQDLTERKRVSNEYATLLETAADPIYLIDEQGIIQEANKAAEKLTGYSRGELVGSFMGIINKSFQSTEDVKRFAKEMKPGESYLKRTVHTTKSGHEIPIEINLRISDEDGQNKFLVIARDVSEREKRQKELLDKNKQLAAAQQIAKLGSWNLDVTKNQLEWSDEIFRIFGETPNAFEGTIEAFYDFVHPDERNLVQNYFNECLTERKPYHMVHRILTKAGEVKHVEENATFDFDDANSILVAHGTVQDITEKVSHEEVLNRQIEQLQRVLSLGALVAFEADLSTKEIKLFKGLDSVNNSSFPYHSLSSFENFMSAIEERHRNFCKRKMAALKQNKIDSFRCEFQLKNNASFSWYEGSISVHEKENGKPRKIFVVLKNQEEQKNKEHSELIGQEKERLRISRDIHDSIGQMLVGTRMMLKTGKEPNSFDIDSLDEMLDSMIKESRMIINNFGISLKNQENFRQAFIDLTEKMRRVYSGKVLINWQGAEQLNDLKLATHIFRIFQEALSNSIKYSRSQTIHVNVRNYDYFFMDVWDNGIGFEVSESSAGFGIENMTERAKQIGAELKVISVPQQGTRVKLRFKY